MRRALLSTAALSIALALPIARGDEPKKDEPKKDEPKKDEPKGDEKKEEPKLSPEEAKAALEKKKRAAIQRGVDWLKKQQKPDGSFDYLDAPFRIQGIEHFVQGCTAFSAFALLKAGVPPTDPVIKKAFDAIVNLPVKHCYSAGAVILAIDACLSWQPPEADDEPAAAAPESGGSQEKKQPAGGDKKDAKKKQDPRLLDLAARCVKFLEDNQKRSLWRYPHAGTEDVSAAQYALLGLDAAERIGLGVSKQCYEKALEYFVENQEEKGPEVKPFGVPGADHSYKELRLIEKELRDKIRKIEEGAKGGMDASGRSVEDQKRLAEEEASRRIYRTGEKEGTGTSEPKYKMFARGWRYMRANDPQASEWQKTVTGSMTASATACLFICKSHLDAMAGYGKDTRKRVDQALRDGCAYLVKNYTVSENPSAKLHHYYFMYSMERAGIIGLVPKYGDHDWYDDGVKMFVSQQKADGSWDAGDHGTAGPIPDTCFALLFVCRGTTPPVRLPERTVTGGGK